MWQLFKKKSFEEKYPEIFQWQVGDRIRVIHRGLPLPVIDSKYLGIDNDKQLVILQAGYFCMKDCANLSLADRKKKAITNNEYNKYLQDVQNAIAELTGTKREKQYERVIEYIGEAKVYEV